MFDHLKHVLLAFLIVVGLGLIAPTILFPKEYSLQWALWGTLSLGLAGLWIYWDHKTRTLSPDEETERMLVECVRRIKKTGSVEAIVSEFRARGASDDTLKMVEVAPQLLRQRAHAGIHTGVGLITVGIVFTFVSYHISNFIGGVHYFVALGAIGAGAGMILSGLLRIRLLRKTSAFLSKSGRPFRLEANRKSSAAGSRRGPFSLGHMRYSKVQISKAFLAANRLLNGPIRPVYEIVQILEPFFDCTEVEGAHGQLHEDIRSMIFALVGDAHRRQGNAREAATWYRRASAISSGGHATIYAHLVCKHRLAEFYSDALKILEEHRRRWFAKPIIEKCFLRLVAWRMWVDKEGREIARTETQDYFFLVENAQRTAS